MVFQTVHSKAAAQLGFDIGAFRWHATAGIGNGLQLGKADRAKAESDSGIAILNHIARSAPSVRNRIVLSLVVAVGFVLGMIRR